MINRRNDHIYIKAMNLHEKLADCHPKLQRGMVYCHQCGNSKKVGSAHCFKYGWPKCCNATMSIDSPEERHKS